MRTTAVSTTTPIEFPHAAQLFRVLRYTGDLDGQRHSTEVAYCVSSLTPDKATAEDLATLLREHWGAIENKLHWVRDTTFGEDASTLRTGTAPQTMAIIRNTLIAAFHLTGWRNLKRARRHFAHAINRCIDLITKPTKRSNLEHDRALAPIHRALQTFRRVSQWDAIVTGQVVCGA